MPDPSRHWAGSQPLGMLQSSDSAGTFPVADQPWTLALSDLAQGTQGGQVCCQVRSWVPLPGPWPKDRVTGKAAAWSTQQFLEMNLVFGFYRNTDFCPNHKVPLWFMWFPRVPATTSCPDRGLPIPAQWGVGGRAWDSGHTSRADFWIRGSGVWEAGVCSVRGAAGLAQVLPKALCGLLPLGLLRVGTPAFAAHL